MRIRCQMLPPAPATRKCFVSLLEQHGLKQRDLAAYLGGESVVSEVLSGKRKLNATHIELLSKRFHVSPAVFFPS